MIPLQGKDFVWFLQQNPLAIQLLLRETPLTRKTKNKYNWKTMASKVK